MSQIEIKELVREMIKEIDGIWMDEYSSFGDNSFFIEASYNVYILTIKVASLQVEIWTTWEDSSSEGNLEPGDQLGSYDFHKEEDIIEFRKFLEGLN